MEEYMRKTLIFLLLVFSLAASIKVDTGEVKNGDVVCIGDTAVVEGKINGDLVAIKCDLTFSGKVNGDLIAIFSKVKAEEGTRVNGDLVEIFSSGNTSVIKVNGSRVGMTGRPGRSFLHKPKFIHITGTGNFFDSYKFVSYLILWGILSLLIFLLFQKNVMLAASSLLNRPFNHWLRGLLIFIVLIILLIIFAILSAIIIGIPFLIIVVFLIIGAILFGYTSIFYAVGNLILNSEVHPVYSVLLGMVMFSFVKSLYLVGSILSLIMIPLAFGITHSTSFGRKLPPSE